MVNFLSDDMRIADRGDEVGEGPSQKKAKLDTTCKYNDEHFEIFSHCKMMWPPSLHDSAKSNIDFAGLSHRQKDSLPDNGGPDRWCRILMIHVT